LRDKGTQAAWDSHKKDREACFLEDSASDAASVWGLPKRLGIAIVGYKWVEKYIALDAILCDLKV
jgi:hypothetical protein